MRSVCYCIRFLSVVKERVSKLSELNSRYQELNTALTNEMDLMKGKEQTMLQQEKRMRYYLITILK